MPDLDDPDYLDPRPCAGKNSNICVAEGCYGEGCMVRRADLRPAIYPETQRWVWADVAAHMNRIADTWEKDGTDPCRVRVTREYANAYRAYAEGFGSPGRIRD